MTHEHTEAKIISPKKRETLTELHYKFCGTLGFRGTPVEEHWSKLHYFRQNYTTIKTYQ